MSRIAILTEEEKIQHKKESQRKYRLKNKDKIREKRKKYRLENQFKINVYQRLYYKKNKQKYLKYIRDWKHKSKESYDNFLKYQKQYYANIKQLRQNEIIYKKYNVKRVILVENMMYKGLLVNLEGYKYHKKYLDEIFTKKQIQFLKQGLIDYILIV